MRRSLSIALLILLLLPLAQVLADEKLIIDKVEPYYYDRTKDTYKVQVYLKYRSDFPPPKSSHEPLVCSIDSPINLTDFVLKPDSEKIIFVSMFPGSEFYRNATIKLDKEIKANEDHVIYCVLFHYDIYYSAYGGTNVTIRVFADASKVFRIDRPTPVTQTIEKAYTVTQTVTKTVTEQITETKEVTKTITTEKPIDVTFVKTVTTMEIRGQEYLTILGAITFLSILLALLSLLSLIGRRKHDEEDSGEN